MAKRDVANLTDTVVENAMLSGAIVSPEILDRFGGLVFPSDFSDANKGHMWGVMVLLRESGLNFDLPTLLSQLKANDVDESLRNSGALMSLLNTGCPEVRWIDQHVTRLLDLSRKRQQVKILAEASSRVLDKEFSSQDISQWLDSRMQSVGVTSVASIRHVREIAADVVDSLEKPTSRGKPVMTGLIEHDEMCGGFLGGEMITLAARPGIGKTKLGMQIAKHVALSGKPVLFVSLEMKDRELITRMLCGLSGVDSRVIRNQTYSQQHISKIRDSAETLEELPLYVWETFAANMAQIRAIAKQQAASNGLGLLVIDYIGKVVSSNPKLERKDHVGDTASRIKDLAKELDVPVLALCQLNRGADDAVPKLNNLADSSEVERNSDVVLFLHPEKEQGKISLIVAKHRHGVVGTLKLIDNPKHVCFDSPILGLDGSREEEISGWDDWNAQ